MTQAQTIATIQELDDAITQFDTDIAEHQKAIDRATLAKKVLQDKYTPEFQRLADKEIEVVAQTTRAIDAETKVTELTKVLEDNNIALPASVVTP